MLPQKKPRVGAPTVLPTGRQELLAWANAFAQAEYTKIEQCADGVVYAHVADAAHDGRFPMQRLSFVARNEDECARNLQVLQQEFKKLHINYQVPVDRLAKGRFQDNNDFLQWCYVYLNSCGAAVQDYDATRRREEALTRQHRARRLGRGGLPAPLCKPLLMTQLPEGELSRAADSPSAGASFREEPAQRYDPSLYGPGEPPAPGSAAAFYELTVSLSSELRQQREAQLKRRWDVAELERERNDLWQQLRTVEELLSGFSSLKSASTIAAVLFEPDMRMADSRRPEAVRS